MDKNLTQLDGGTLEENLAELKEFCGLRPDRSFQEIELYDTDDNKEKTAYETFKFTVKRIVEYVTDFIENEEDKHSDFSQGRALAYKEIIDVIQNSLTSDGFDLKEFNVDFDMDKVL